jgi:tetratricopeptide (TPR) repeat protein
LEFELAVNTLQDVIDRHPSWIVARVFHSGALAHLAEERDSLELMDQAVDEISVTLSFVKENALATVAGASICRQAFELYRLHGKPVDEVQRMGLSLADRLLAKYPNYSLGQQVASDFYDSIGNEELAKQTEQYIFHHFPGWNEVAISYLYIAKSSEEIIRIIEEQDSDDPSLLITKASILADIPSRREEAKRIYKSFTKTHKSPYARFRAIQVLLLLGEFEEARAECQKWMNEQPQSRNLRPYHSSARGGALAIRLIAEPSRLEGFGGENTNKSYQALKEYLLGVIALGKGNRKVAQRHFEAYENMGRVGEFSNWARAFKTHLANDPEWPRANKVFHPDSAVSQK